MPECADAKLFQVLRREAWQDPFVYLIPNDQAAGAFSSMTLFLAAIVVLAAGLLGTLFLLFRDAHRGTKGPKRFLLSNWK
jgi:hypothetical protein